MGFLFVTPCMSNAVARLRRRRGDFADMWEVALDLCTQAEKGKDAEAGIQEKVDGASHTHVSRALRGTKHGDMDLRAGMEIGK